MRETHHIDDLFRRALSDAEATPPPTVWDGVVHKRHFGHRVLARLERKWGWGLLLLLLLGGSITTWALRDLPHSAAPVSSKSSPSDVVPVAAVDADKGSTSLLSAGEGAVPARIVHAGTLSSPASLNRITDRSVDPVPGSDRGQPASNGRSAPGIDGTTLGAAGLDAEPKDGTTMAGTISSPSEPGAMVSGNDARALSIDVSILVGRPIHWAFVAPEATVLPREVGLPVYLMPSGQWIMGVQYVHGPAQGEWQDTGGLSRELNDAEAWRSRSAIALMGGRRWVNGFGLFVGVEYDQRSSRFLRTQNSPGALTADLDTSWTATTIGATTYSTWNIDTLFTQEPGGPVAATSRNRYRAVFGLLQAEYEWQLGGRLALNGGLQARFGATVSRTGRTLAVEPAPSDSGGIATGRNQVVDLGSSEVNERFGTITDLGVAVDLGYRLSDRFSLRAGPYWRHLLIHGRDRSFTSSTFGALLRLDYAFPNKDRARPAQRP